jgi:hypothetical protein
VAITRLRPRDQHRLFRGRIEHLVICDKRRAKENAGKEKRNQKQHFHIGIVLLLARWMRHEKDESADPLAMPLLQDGKTLRFQRE